MPPDTKYAKSGDVRVAYQVTGEGPADLVLAPGTASHLDLDWEWPEKASFLERLGSFCQADPLRQARNGPVGSSNRRRDARGADGRHQGRDGRSRERPGSHLRVLRRGQPGRPFSSTYPQRTRALLAWGAQARWIRADDYPWGPTQEEADQDIAYLAENGVTLEYLTGPSTAFQGSGIRQVLHAIPQGIGQPGRFGGPRTHARHDRYARHPAQRSRPRAGDEPDRGSGRQRRGGPRLCRPHPRCPVRRVPGDTHPFFTGPATGEILAEIETFVTGYGCRRQPTGCWPRCCSPTSSVRRAATRAIGDRPWQRAAAAPRRGAERCSATGGRDRHRRRRFLRDVRRAGAGHPVRQAIRGRGAGLGFKVRAGVHTGEVELIGDDVAGIAVHIGARVAALARPGEVLDVPNRR